MKRLVPIGSLLLSIGCGGTSEIGTVPSAPADAAPDTTWRDVSTVDQAIPESSVVDAKPEAKVEAGIPCMAPTDASKSSLCVQLLPEPIDLVPSDPDFDGKGVMAYDIFTAANPTAADTPIATLTRGSAGNEMDLSKPINIERFDGLPPTVYVRVRFADSFNSHGLLWGGWWVAGTDYSQGLSENMPLAAIALTPGQGLTVSMDLVALRQLRVRLTRGPDLVPAGDGEGPITVAAVASSSSQVHGIARGCGNINTSATIDVIGFVVGTGPYTLVGVLDDYGIGLVNGGDLPPGSIISFDPTNPVPDTLAYTARSYKVSYALSLGYVLPPPDGGADNGTCPTADGGTTDAAAE